MTSTICIKNICGKMKMIFCVLFNDMNIMVRYVWFLKAADIATFIVQKKDLGTKATLVETVEEKRHHLGTGKKFWSAIGGLKTISCKCSMVAQNYIM